MALRCRQGRPAGLADTELQVGAGRDKLREMALDGVERRIEGPGVVSQQIVRRVGCQIEIRQRIGRASHARHGRIDQGDLEQRARHHGGREVAGDPE